MQGTPSDLSSSSVNVKVSEAVCSEEIGIRLELGLLKEGGQGLARRMSRESISSLFTLGVTQGGQCGPGCYQDLSCRLCLFDIGAPSEKSKANALLGINTLDHRTRFLTSEAPFLHC